MSRASDRLVGGLAVGYSDDLGHETGTPGNVVFSVRADFLSLASNSVTENLKL